MRRIAIVFLCGLIGSLGMAVPADSAEMFPAHLNDCWMLQTFSGPSTDIQVTEVTKTGWLRYEKLFDMGVWLKPQGTRVFVRPDARSPKALLYDFDAAQGTQWPVEFGGLVGSVTVAERDATVGTAYGTRAGCTAFSFAWDNLADAGVAMQWFCPDLGLVKQDKLSIAGVVTEYTAAAAIRGEIELGYLGQGMNVRLDQGDAFGGALLKARLELWDTTGMQREFRSETSQLFDVRIVNERGETVRLWSADKVFLPVVTRWILDGEKDFEAELPLANQHGHVLPPGLYTIEGWIIDAAARPTARTQIRLN
jgi:hypothetical protein